MIKLKDLINEGPDSDLVRSLKYINNDLFRIINKYEDKTDIEKHLRTWMMGLHAKIKKMGIKL